MLGGAAQVDIVSRGAIPAGDGDVNGDGCSDVLSSGAQNISWDTRDEQGHRVAAGIYLLRLEHGSRGSAAKLVVHR